MKPSFRRETAVSTPNAPLPPSVEQRLSAWVNLQERFARAPAPRIRPTITLSRQYGCEGFPLALRLQELFQEATCEPWNIYDKALVERVSREEHIPLQLLRHLGDLSRRLESLGLDGAGHVTHDEAFAKVASLLVQIAGVGNAVVVGRGGAVLCKGLRNCFHFRLVAPVDDRVASLVRRLGLPVGEATRRVKEESKGREEFIKTCLHANVADPVHYDAIFNSARHDLEDIAQAILAYVQSVWEDPTTFSR